MNRKNMEVSQVRSWPSFNLPWSPQIKGLCKIYLSLGITQEMSTLRVVLDMASYFKWNRHVQKVFCLFKRLKAVFIKYLIRSNLNSWQPLLFKYFIFKFTTFGIYIICSPGDVHCYNTRYDGNLIFWMRTTEQHKLNVSLYNCVSNYFLEHH